MSFFKKKKSSGMFVPSGGGFMQFTGEGSRGSLNDMVMALGYHPNQAYSSDYAKNSKDKINIIFFEVFTRNIIFIHTPDSTTYIAERDVRRHLGDFSVRKYFDSIKINEVLTDGIESGALDAGFMARVLQLKDVSPNGMFFSEKINAYLYFTAGRLTDFHFDDGLFPWAKYVREVNPRIFKLIEGDAAKYWAGNDFQVAKEINLQCEAWSHIPEALNNPYLHLHRKENGWFNLHMLRVCHYGYPINLQQFLEINHGRWKEVESDTNFKDLRCGNFIYRFATDSEELIHSKRLN